MLAGLHTPVDVEEPNIAEVCSFSRCMLLSQFGGGHSRHSSVWGEGFAGSRHRRVDADFAHLRPVLGSSGSGLESETLLSMISFTVGSLLSAPLVRLRLS